MQVYQLLGKHILKENSSLHWGLGLNLVDAEEPNRIRNRMGYDLDQLFLNMHGIGNFDNRRSSQQIKDRELNAYLKDQFILNLGKQSFSTSVGLNFRYKSRGFESRFVGADIKDISTAGLDIDHLSLLFTQDAFDSSLIRELPQDEYAAVLGVIGAFVHSGFEFGNLSGNFGLRLEADQLKLEWDINNDQYYDLETRDSLYAGIYPSLNLKYELSEKHFLRLSGSKTITIPEFKELAPFPYVSPTGSITKAIRN
jgi:outer membrane receptor protein involved in Fe transport